MSNLNSSHYCIHCGSPLQPTLIENRLRKKCPACGWIFYQQLKVGAAALIEQNGALLLLRRANDPWKGTWNLPAGYVEVDEDPAQAAEREALEETGLHVRATQLVHALYFDDDPRGNGVHLIYACEIAGGELLLSAESTRLGFFAPGQIPDHLCGAGHAAAILAWQEAKRHGG